MTTTTDRSIPRRPLLALAGVALASLGACGDDGPDAASGTIEITAVDYAYEGVPERVRAGSTIALANESDVEVHELVAVRLPDEEDRPVSELVTLPPDELAAFFPGLETVVIAPPGAEGFPVEGDGTLDEPGRYAFICVIPTGADPDEYLTAAAEAEGGPPQVDGGPPHIVGGMYAEVTVVD
jgi:plastocyanin